MTRLLGLITAFVAIGFSAPQVHAQLPDLPLSLELRAGVLAPLSDWSVPDRNTNLRVGSGLLLSGAVRVELPGPFSAYGSYDHGLPQCEDCGLFELDDRLVDRGFGAGIGYTFTDVLPLELRVDFGGIYHQLTFRGGGETRPSDHGFGLEVGLTGSVPVLPALFLEPSIAWRGYSARFAFEDGGTREIDVRYLAPRLGLRYRF